MRLGWRVSELATFLTADRLQTVGDAREIGAWVRFEFPGRGNTYSDMKWNWDHFTGVDWVCS